MAASFPDTADVFRRTLNDDPAAFPAQQFWVQCHLTENSPDNCTLWWDLNLLHASLKMDAGEKRPRQKFLQWVGGLLQNQEWFLHQHEAFEGPYHAGLISAVPVPGALGLDRHGTHRGGIPHAYRCTSLALLLCFWVGSSTVHHV